MDIEDIESKLTDVFHVTAHPMVFIRAMALVIYELKTFPFKDVDEVIADSVNKAISGTN